MKLPGYSQPRTMHEQIEKDAEHPRQHALVMASANHLRNMGHIDDDTHAKITTRASRAMKKSKAPKLPKDDATEHYAPFGSFAPK